VPGLRGLQGVWGTREATGMKAVPRRLLVLGGGRAGVELAQVVRRLPGQGAGVAQYFHSQADAQPGDLAANVAHPHHAEYLAGQLRADISVPSGPHLRRVAPL